MAQTSGPKQDALCAVAGQIVQSGGQPIKKADVSLDLVGERQELENETHSAVTDAEGRFRVGDLKPGTYRLYYQRAGFVDAEKRHHGNRMLLSLQSGQEIKDLLLHMAPAAVITGKVTDIDGDPVANAEVVAIPQHFGRNIVPAGWVGYTNELGEYRIGGLAPNRYVVLAVSISQLNRAVEDAKSGKKSPVYGATYYPGTIDKSQALSLTVNADDQMPANITLALTHVFHVRGEVTGLPNGSTDVSIILRPLDDQSGMTIVNPWPVDNGKFDIPGVLSGSYSALLQIGNSKDHRFMRGDPVIQVADSDVDGLRISPLPSGLIRGRLRMENGQRMDWSSVNVRFYSKPRPLRGGSGTAWDAFFWDVKPVDADAKSDGSFEVKDVPADTYRVSLRSTEGSFDGYFLRSVNLRGRDVTEAGISTGSDMGLLDIVVSPNGATVEGTVVDEKGNPASDISVIAIPEQQNRGDLYRTKLTDVKGSFSMSGLGPGEYQIVAVDEDIDDPDEIHDPEFARSHELQHTVINLNKGEHKTLTIKLASAGE